MTSGNFYDIDFDTLPTSVTIDVQEQSYEMRFYMGSEEVQCDIYLNNIFRHSSPVLYGLDIFRDSGIDTSATPLDLVLLSEDEVGVVSPQNLGETVFIFSDYVRS